VGENGSSGNADYENGASTNGMNNRRSGGRQQNGNNPRPKSTTTNGSVNSQPLKSTMPITEDALSKRKLIEKEATNLAKHEAATERNERLFKEEMGKSHDRIRRAFDEMRQRLNEREKMMLGELERCKSEGIQFLERGKVHAKQLRVETDRAPSMNDRQISDLREKIQLFVADRRLEEELGRTIRFQFEPDQLFDGIQNFGEVIPIGKAPEKLASQTSLVNSVDEDGANWGVVIDAKPINEISSGGICMKSDSMTAEQLALLTKHLKESLRLQGISEDILPDVSGVAGAMPAPRRRAPPSVRPEQNNNRIQNQNGRAGGGRRNGTANH
jgi:hypothetical protein